MKMKKVFTVHPRICILFGAILLLQCPAFAKSMPVWRVDNLGNLTVNGVVFRIKGGSWTGLEGRQELPNDEVNPGGAPMELYMGNLFWSESTRTYDQDITEFKAMGLNVVRLPIVPQTLDPNDPQGRDPNLKNAASVRIANARLAMEMVIRKLDAAGIYVILDIHSCSNFVGWRAGRLDAHPPYPDDDWADYNFKRGNCSCSATGNPIGVTKIQAYDESKWLDNLRTLAGLGVELGVTNIMGIDIFNEPWDYTWAEWKSMIDKAYAAINAVNPNILIFAQGISALAGQQDSNPATVTQVPHGSEETNPCWGENLYEAGDNPPSMPRNRLVFSPHAFGPSVFVQRMFMDPNQPQCTGLEGDAAGDAKCNIVINPALLEQGWEEHFGYLKSLGYAVVIGEFGGKIDWPRRVEPYIQNRYSYLTDTTVDWQWQNAFVNYLARRGIRDVIYWSINPESLDTGGIYDDAYDPITNIGGWGVWTSPNTKKLNLLQTLWGPTIDPTPTPSPPPPRLLGDVNGDKYINIVDALMTAQYSVGLVHAGFIALNADLNCDGSINIVDALMIAQYYVGILSSFNCL